MRMALIRQGVRMALIRQGMHTADVVLQCHTCQGCSRAQEGARSPCALILFGISVVHMGGVE